MRALVTGATGFIGSHVTRQLVQRGAKVRVILRPESDRRNISDLEVEAVCGLFYDPGLLRDALAGCDALYHIAAYNAFWSLDRNVYTEINAEGTRTVLQAAWELRIGRVVYTSTCDVIQRRADGVPADESQLVEMSSLIGPYERSKLLAEQSALEFARKGLPVVIVSPTAPVGPNDVYLTPPARMLLDFLHRRLPAYLDTGLNVGDVRDVALGHLLAAEKGRPGERYILGGENLMLTALFRCLEEISGVPAPTLKMPYWVAYSYAFLGQLLADYVTHKPPRVPLSGVAMANRPFFFTSEKAVLELGYRPSPVRQALRDAIAWFRGQGYAK